MIRICHSQRMLASGRRNHHHRVTRLYGSECGRRSRTDNCGRKLCCSGDNSLSVQRYDDPETISAIVNELGRSGLHVERWVPKAGFSGRTFDLRVVMIAGEVRHTVMRTSVTPMTNLHLVMLAVIWKRCGRRFLRQAGATRWSRAGMQPVVFQRACTLASTFCLLLAFEAT